MKNKYDTLAVNTLRVLSASMITKAKSGHPGICLGSAPIVHVLFTEFLNNYSGNSKWPGRDRFVLSAGHGSALLYALLHVSGFDLNMEDLMAFRQKGSRTPGHPEYGHTAGVEVTTGPLGQGLATAVGFAMAEKNLASRYNKPDATLFDYKTYVLCGDGDLQEGLAMEACSLAGNFKLDNLVVLFDSNDIQLDGPTYKATSDNIKLKFEAMNWSYLKVEDGNDLVAISKAIAKANSLGKPAIIEIKTIIGYGASNQGTSAVHGKPLTAEQLEELKVNLDYHYPEFTVPSEVYDLYAQTFGKRSKASYDKYQDTLQYYKEKYPNEYNELTILLNNNYQAKDIDLPVYDSPISTRKVTGQVLSKLAEYYPGLVAGSADLASSCMIKGIAGDFAYDNYAGRNVCYGVREHAMASIVNGLTLSGLKGVGSGFFVFSDYLKDSIRLGAIMHIPSLFIFSHDSVCVGEDGPTHEPVEQLAGLRAMPNLNVVRPADAKEATWAVLGAMHNNSYPTVITTSRQDLPVLAETNYLGFIKGAYICFEPKTEPTHIIISCGSDLNICLQAAKELEAEGVMTRVVSMPSEFIFRMQTEEYKELVLPHKITKRLAVEMGSTQPWYRYASNVLGIDDFGQSMPIKQIYEFYGFTTSHIKELIEKM